MAGIWRGNARFVGAAVELSSEAVTPKHAKAANAKNGKPRSINASDAVAAISHAKQADRAAV